MTLILLGLAMGAAIGAFLWEMTRGERLARQLDETRRALRDLRLVNLFNSIPAEHERDLAARYWSAAQRTRPDQNAEMN